MYQGSKKVVTIKEYCCFDHSDFLAHSLFAFDVCCGSLDTSIFGNSSSAASNTRSRLTSRLSVSYDYELKIDLNRLNVCLFYGVFRTNIPIQHMVNWLAMQSYFSRSTMTKFINDFYLCMNLSVYLWCSPLLLPSVCMPWMASYD